MSRPILKKEFSKWKVILRSSEHEEFFHKEICYGTGGMEIYLDNDFRLWLKETDPKYRGKWLIWTVFEVEFSNDDAAMAFRMRYNAEIILESDSSWGWDC